MRIGVWRAVFAGVLLPALAVMAAAQPPVPVPLPKPDPEASDRSAERAKLQAELLLLLKRLSAAPAPAPFPTPVAPSPKKDVTTDAAKVDAIRAGMNQFRDNDFEAARRTFQLIDPATLSREDRAFVRYMLACSLRRLGLKAEAEVIYREVANSGDDEFLASCAIWQLSLIRSEQELQVQLEQLRARAKSR
jgi:hypothetical protein